MSVYTKTQKLRSILNVGVIGITMLKCSIPMWKEFDLYIQYIHRWLRI